MRQTIARISQKSIGYLLESKVALRRQIVILHTRRKYLVALAVEALVIPYPTLHITLAKLLNLALRQSATALVKLIR